MTLHDAIIKLIKEKGRRMSTQEIADELNLNGWYRKRDGSKISAFQIHGRTRRYSQYFDREGSMVSLIEDGPHRIKSIESSVSLTQGPDTRTLTTNCKDLKRKLMNKKVFKAAGEIDRLVPNSPGLYCLWIRDIDKLPDPFDKYLAQREHDIIYIGIASKNLNRRMLNQELRANGHGTFFRSIGAMLGYRPPKGSLIQRRNKRNYKFTNSDEQSIISWINRNLIVNWVEYNGDMSSAETLLIKRYKPLINLAKNPAALPLLSQLRNECVEIANSY